MRTPSPSPTSPLRVLAAVLLALLPVVATALSPWAAGTAVVLLGLLPTLSAAPSGPRAMTSALGGTAVVAFAVVVLAGTGGWVPVLGTAAVVGLGMATGSLSVHGLHPVGAASIVLAAQLLVDPSSVVEWLAARLTPIGAATVVTGVVALVGAWAIGVVAVMLRGVRLPVVSRPATLPYGLLLAVLCGAFTLVCLLWFRGTNAWWSVMTVALVLQPTHGETRTKLYGRIAGTVLGGVVVALLVLIVPWSSALLAVGLIASLASVGLLLAGAAYWTYAVAVTISVVLLTFDGDAAIAGDLQRILITVIAGLVTAAAVSAAAALLPADQFAEPPGQ